MRSQIFIAEDRGHAMTGRVFQVAFETDSRRLTAVQELKCERGLTFMILTWTVMSSPYLCTMVKFPMS